MKILELAYIGCGAVVRKSHLPAIQAIDKFFVSTLIDVNSEQTTSLAKTFNVPNCTSDLFECIDQFQVAVLATPATSHFAIAKEMIQAKKHVLVEKPLALNISDAEQLIELAKSNDVILAVGLMRRYLPHYQLCHSLLLNEIVGNVIEFSLEEGGVFNWPVQSANFYNMEHVGGGVLMDTGAHILDALLWWLGDYSGVKYYDDNQGGVEAECMLEMTLKSGAKGSVKLSRLRNLSNKFLVRGEKGELTMDLFTGEIKLAFNDSKVVLNGSAVDCYGQTSMSTVSLFERQYFNLYNSIFNLNNKSQVETSHLVLGQDCLSSIKLIEECYNNRALLPHAVL